MARPVTMLSPIKHIIAERNLKGKKNPLLHIISVYLSFVGRFFKHLMAFTSINWPILSEDSAAQLTFPLKTGLFEMRQNLQKDSQDSCYYQADLVS
jgi:hypothetical protein